MLAGEKGLQNARDPVEEITRSLGWEAPQSPEALAQRWIQELDSNQVNRAALIASVPVTKNR